MDTTFYDVVVCGGETTGLVAGALLARRGFRVLLLGHEPDHAGFDAGATMLSRGPALLPPLDDPPAGRVLKELDCTALLKRRAGGGGKPGLRVICPGREIDLFRNPGTGSEPPAMGSVQQSWTSPDANPAAIDRELGRAFGGSGTAVATAMERLGTLGRLVDPLLASAITLPPNGFWERREVGRLESLLPKPHADLFSPLPVEHLFRTVAGAPAALSTALVPHEIGPVGEARAFELARQGAPVLEQGLAGLHDLLLGRFDTFGGDRRERLSPVEIVLKRGRAVGVRVLPRDETIGCDHLIWAGRATTLHAALGGAGPSAGRGDAPLRVAGYRHALALLCEPGAFAEGTPSRIVAIADPSRPLTEDNALAITLGAPGPRAPDRIPVWVECGVPVHAVDAGPGYLRALRGRLVHMLGRLFPTLPSRLALIASPYDGLPPEPGGPTSAAASTKAAGAPLPTPPPLFARPAPRRLDVLGLPHATGIKNLYLAGRENLPGLGLEGELISGWGVARLVSGDKVRRSTRQRRMLLGD